jgi:hypothetical protein
VANEQNGKQIMPNGNTEYEEEELGIENDIGQMS